MKKRTCRGAPARFALMVTLAASGFAFPSSAVASHAGPLAGQWHLDADTSGGSNDLTPDSSGHGLDAVTAEATLALASGGRFGNALSAANVSVLTAGPSALLQPAGVTLLAWVRHSGAPPALRYIAGQGDDGGTCNGPSYALYTGVGAQTGLQFFIRPEGDTYKPSPIAGSSVWDGQWHLVAGTFDGSTVRMYVDGVEVGTGTPASGKTIDYGFAGSKFFFGGYPVPSCGNGDFPGGVDEVRVYGRGLTRTEIARLAAPGAVPPALVPDGGAEPVAPVNVAPPSIRAAAAGSYTCDPGAWRNVSSGFSFRWVAFRGSTSVIAATQDYTPGPSVYGYPVACQVTASGPSGPVTATSSRVLFTSLGLNKLPPAYGDVRIRGIDVFQTVQPKSRAGMFGYSPDRFFPGLCGGGTPTSWIFNLRRCVLGDRDPQNVRYEGVTLDRNKPTTAVVYVDVAGAAARDPRLAYDLELSATRGGRSLGEPVVRSIRDPRRSDTAWVQHFERDSDFSGTNRGGDNSEGIPIALPSAWRTGGGGPLRLHARVRFPGPALGTASYGTRQCDTDGCEANDAFTLDDIPFQDFPQLLIATLELRRTAGGQGNLREAASVLARIRDVYPGGSRMLVSRYNDRIDITEETDNTTAVPTNTKGLRGSKEQFICRNSSGTYGASATDVTTRSCRFNAVGSRVLRWITDHPARRVGTDGVSVTTHQYHAVFGVHEYPTGAGFNEPGWANGDIRTVSRTAPATADATPRFTATANDRPLTAAGHELGHILTAPHAGHDCPVPVGQPGNLTGPGTGPNEGEPWRPDNIGRLLSTKFVRRASLGRGTPTSYRATVDGPFPLGPGSAQGDPLLDIMSYCTNTGDTATSDGDSWVSARNWNRYSRELADLEDRLGRRIRLDGGPRVGNSRLARAAGVGQAAAARQGFAVGVAGPAGGHIARVVPPDGQDAVPAPDPSSPFKLRSRDAAGRVMLEAGVTVQRPTSHDRNPDGGFAGPVASGAAAVELVRGATVLDRVTRSRPPSVRLIAPRRGIRVRGRSSLKVRWRASDRDRDRLEATIDFSADNGRSWRTIHESASRGRATIPGRFLAASKRARVRVNISDGFSERTATSRSFTAQGLPPQVRILTPLRGDPVRPGERTTLIGSASDDLGRPLGGKALTWFAGRKRLGRGAEVRARLPRGRVRLTLLARDRTRRKGVARLRLRVAAPHLRILNLRVPPKVAKKARSMTVRIRPSAPATLVAGGKRFRLRAKASKLTISLPRRPAVGVLKVRFKLSPRGGKTTRTIRGTFSVART